MNGEARPAGSGARNTKRPAVFLDKDGTLLEDVPYNVDPEQMRFAPRVASALRRLQRLDVPLFVISNQPGVALGLFELQALDGVERRLAAMFARCGCRLDGFYACPHHVHGKIPAFTCACLCRKPMPGLINRAAAEHHLDLSRSWMVGDILDDVEAGSRAGCRTILIDNGNETEWLRNAHNAWLRTPDHSVADLDMAARIIGGGTDGPDGTSGPTRPRGVRLTAKEPL